MTDDRLIKVPLLDESCPICWGSMTLHTTAEQRDGYAFWALDGDRVTCDECDHSTQMSCDGEGAYVMDLDCGCEGCRGEREYRY